MLENLLRDRERTFARRTDDYKEKTKYILIFNDSSPFLQDLMHSLFLLNIINEITGQLDVF